MANIARLDLARSVDRWPGVHIDCGLETGASAQSLLHLGALGDPTGHTSPRMGAGSQMNNRGVIFHSWEHASELVSGVAT
eukprot:10246950-Alexandrium_andersonii.AAC.1